MLGSHYATIICGELTMWRVSVWVATLWCAAGAAALAGAESPRCASAAPCRYIGGSSTEHQYQVEGNKIIIEFAANKLNVKCYGQRVLESPALPAFAVTLRVSSVWLHRCPPPGAGSFSAALRALNVTLVFADGAGELVLHDLPPAPPLAARHFLGLERLAALSASAPPPPAPRAAPAPGFLSALRGLRALALSGVRLPPGELDPPPAALRRLDLRGADVERLPAALLESPDLFDMTLDEPRLAVLSMPPALRTLTMFSCNHTRLRIDEIPTLETLSLHEWSEERPAALARCDSLRTLLLTAPAMEALPERWVAACPRLERLVLQSARGLGELPSTLLEGASALVQLTIRQTELAALPEGLLDHVPKLRILDLSGNRLRKLPSGMFLGPRALVELDLSSNELTGAALLAMAALRQLERLNLAGNARLGSGVCDSGYSPLLTLTKLKFLLLNKTNISRICEDWRSSMTLLETLDLRNTSISELWFDDLQYRRDIPDAEVRLQGAPVGVVELTAEEYGRALAAPASGATLQLDTRLLACDCRMYWTRLALEQAPHAVRVLGLRCRTGLALKDAAPDEMYCAAADACDAAELPRACACGRRPRIGGHVVRADCTSASPGHVPRLRAAPDTFYRLLLPSNNITELSARDLPPYLEELDLRDNLIKNVDEETAAALGRVGSLRLAGNPLACDCRAAPLLRALHARRAAAAELAGVTCGGELGGVALAAAPAEDCAPLGAWLAAAVAALLALAAAVVAFLSSRELRVFAKVILHRWGVRWRAPEPDDGRRFDAFVSFSHEDEAVVLELVKRLEAGPAPYRLCLHYRDWVPGRWIPEQIVESVRQSRRTLALVSRHFLKSTWARAEFREAHAHALRDVTPRLVVVLLEEPAALPLDSELRRYLRTNTYVRWGDPWFWDKLALALPPPRPPRPPPEEARPVADLASPTTPEDRTRAPVAPPAPRTPDPRASPALSVEQPRSEHGQSASSAPQPSPVPSPPAQRTPPSARALWKWGEAHKLPISAPDPPFSRHVEVAM